MQKLRRWYLRKKPKEQLLEQLAEAKTFQEWETTAIQLDEVLGNDLWCVNPSFMKILGYILGLCVSGSPGKSSF
jgi:hypothetical protein